MDSTNVAPHLGWDVLCHVVDRLLDDVCPIYTVADVARHAISIARGQGYPAADMLRHVHDQAMRAGWQTREPAYWLTADAVLNMYGRLGGLVKVSEDHAPFHNAAEVRARLRRIHGTSLRWLKDAVGVNRSVDWLLPHVLPVAPCVPVHVLRDFIDQVCVYAARLRCEDPRMLRCFVDLRKRQIGVADGCDADFDAVLDAYGEGTGALASATVERALCERLQARLAEMPICAFRARAHRRVARLNAHLIPADLVEACARYVTEGEDADVLRRVAARAREMLVALARKEDVVQLVGEDVLVDDELDDDDLRVLVQEACATREIAQAFQRQDMDPVFEMEDTTVVGLANVYDRRSQRYLMGLKQEWVQEVLEDAMMTEDDIVETCRDIFDHAAALDECLAEGAHGVTWEDCAAYPALMEGYLRNGYLDSLCTMRGVDETAAAQLVWLVRNLKRDRWDAL